MPKLDLCLTNHKGPPLIIIHNILWRVHDRITLVSLTFKESMHLRLNPWLREPKHARANNGLDSRQRDQYVQHALLADVLSALGQISKLQQ